MKKLAAIALACTLTVPALTGCSKDSAPVVSQQDANFLPEATYCIIEETPVPVATYEPLPEAADEPVPGDAAQDGAMPTETPVPAATELPAEEPTTAPEPTETAVPDMMNYTYSELSDDAFGFTFNFPTSWENLPGKYTACFREIVEDGDFPARVAVTKKTMAHKPTKENTILKQFQSYASNIKAQYDEKTFEYGDLNKDASFMGRKAMEITYLAYEGDIEVMGYMICCAIDYNMYTFHFCASYEDYPTMLPTMTRMRDSVKVVE